MVNDKSLTARVQFVLRQLELDSGAIAAELLEDIRHLTTQTSSGASETQLLAKRAAVERKKERALDAFLDGQITGEELALMRTQYGRELASLDGQLQSIQDAVHTLETQKTGFDHIVTAIHAGLEHSEEVFRAVIESVTGWDACLDIKVCYVPGLFRLWYTTAGKRDEYTTTIERWEWQEG